MKIVEKNINELVMYENNPRKNDEAVKYVANSIKEFGFKVPIIVDKDNVIVAGHTRLKAAKQLKIDKVPCIVADDLTDEQIKAFRLADNKVAEFAEWDEELLEKELDGIFNLDMEGLGFEEDYEDNDDFLINENNEKGQEKLDHILKIDKRKVFMTEEEYEMISEKLESYTEDHGVTFGFVRYLCER